MLAHSSSTTVNLGDAMDGDLELSAVEISAMFDDPAWSSRFPPILTIPQAAELLQVSVETIRCWRSRGELDCCSRRVGKHVRIFRDRLIAWAAGNPTVFNDSKKPVHHTRTRKEV